MPVAAKKARLLPFIEPQLATLTDTAEARDVQWLEPTLVAEISFVERTDEGLVRHASFQGLREDKPADEVETKKVL